MHSFMALSPMFVSENSSECELRMARKKCNQADMGGTGVLNVGPSLVGDVAGGVIVAVINSISGDTEQCRMFQRRLIAESREQTRQSRRI